jgi:hypothetical protein
VVRFSRLRRGEIIAALSGAVLLVLLFAVPWESFASDGGHTAASGWVSFRTLRWPMIVCAVLGLLLGYVQTSREAPALAVSLDVILVTLAAITTLVLLIRLLTRDASPMVGGFAGLVASAGLTTGAFMSLRQEDGWVPDDEHPIERVAVGRSEH